MCLLVSVYWLHFDLSEVLHPVNRCMVYLRQVLMDTLPVVEVLVQVSHAFNQFFFFCVRDGELDVHLRISGRLLGFDVDPNRELYIERPRVFLDGLDIDPEPSLDFLEVPLWVINPVVRVLRVNSGVPLKCSSR